MVPFRPRLNINTGRTAAGYPEKEDGNRSNRFNHLLCVSAAAVLLSACNHVPYLCDDISQYSLTRGGSCLSNDGQNSGRTTAITTASTSATGLDESNEVTGGAGETNQTDTDPDNSGSSGTSADAGSKSNKGHGNDDEQNGAGKDGFDADNPGKGGSRG